MDFEFSNVIPGAYFRATIVLFCETLQRSFVFLAFNIEKVDCTEV